VAPGVLLPLPLLGAGEVLHYMPPPAPYDPRVQAWQTKLLSLGISVGPEGADGKFGDHTRTATTTFQKMANAEAAKSGAALIGVNGMLDAPTLARAALVFPLPKPTAAAKPAPAPKPPTYPTQTPVVVPAPQVVAMPAPMPMPMPMQPQQPIVIPMPAGQPPIVLPPPPMPATGVMVQTPAGPVAVPMPAIAPPMPLPVLAKGELLWQGMAGAQTANAKTAAWQNKLISLGLMQRPAPDALGKFGPLTTAATKTFQGLANLFLAAHPIVVDGVKVSKLAIDGKVGGQTLGAAAHANAPAAPGGAAAFSGFGAPAAPMAASPLPGVVPPMMPAPIDPRVAMASRLLNNLSMTSPGAEDRVLVAAFQAQEGLRASGYYQPGTALALAKLGMIPPAPRYWPSTGRAKAKRNYARELMRFASNDVQRREEWERAAAAA
jgi:peptidoglycan hydrolase-like protein with peptidoglycan-binding domain